MRISIIVPAYNEERLIRESLRHITSALVSFTGRGWETELVVCDNNSSDRTADVAREAGARVVFEPVNQIARARNRGAAVATGDWMVFVDADSHPSSALFEEVAEQIELGRCLAGGVTVVLAGASVKIRFLTGIWNGLSRAVLWLAGSFIFCQAEAFRAIGGFSNELFVGEEIDLSRRLKRLARTRKKKIVVLHRHPLVTSPRKLHLYSWREHLRFLVWALLTGGRALRDRAACAPWYDGRR